MIIDFNKIEELAFPGMNGGTGLMTVRMYNDEKYRIIPTTIHSGGSIGMHRQTSGDDMNYILSGIGRAICDGVEEELRPGVLHICRCVTMLFDQSECELKKGSVFVVPEGIRFKLLSATPDMELETIVFQVQMMNVVYSLLGSEADFGTLDVAFWCDKRMTKPFSRLLVLDYESLRTAVLQPDLVARNKMITSGLVHLLLTLYNAAEDRPEAASVDNGKRSRLILNHFYELADAHVPLGERSISFYADQLCISSRYLFKVCKSETGKTPKEIIHQFLIGEIKNALLTSESSNQQIADRLGFPDQSAFGQFFKRQEGMSPSEFRKRYR